MKTMDQLFHALLQDVYYAEKELTKALPKMAKEADNEELKKAFTDHLKETEGHVERLEKAFEMIGKTAKGKKCDAILGIVAEGKEVMDEVDDEQTLDAGLIAATMPNLGRTSRKTNDSQKRPKDRKAVVPNVLPLRNSMIPAIICAIPP